MRYINLIAFLFFLVLFSACNEDGADFILKYDGANNTAPELPASTYESGVVFPFGFDGNDAGNELYAVRIYIKELPRTAMLKVYMGDNFESNIVYEKSILREISSEDWLTHTLDTPIVLDGNDLWVAFQYEQQDGARVLGCDDGPGVLNSNWHYDAGDNQWRPFNDRTGADINWNIRALVRIPEEG